MTDPSRFKDRDQTSVLPHCRKMMGAEKRVTNLDQEGYRSLGKILQGPVRDTVRARSLADSETTNGFLNLVRVG